MLLVNTRNERLCKKPSGNVEAANEDVRARAAASTGAQTAESDGKSGAHGTPRKTPYAVVVVANEIPRRLRRAQAVPHALRPQTHPSVPTPFATARSEPPIATARSRRPRLGAPAAGRRRRSPPAMDARATRRDERRVRGVPHRIRRPAQGGAGLGDLAALCAVEEGAGG